MEMFRCKRAVRLSDTDATGVLYFSQQFRIALEAFEEFLESCGLSLNQLLKDKDYLIPIVHAEADYFSPLCVGSVVDIELTLKKRGTSSFTLGYRLFDGKEEKGSVTIVHVATSKIGWKAMPLPGDLLHCLERLANRREKGV